MPTVIEGDYEWDEDKARRNVEKHGVAFPEAVLALEDPHAFTIEDSVHQERDLTVGLSARGVLVVVSAERRDRTRIISARKAMKHEELSYEANRT
jgi:uncharacterized DUF497 family protein